MAREKKSVFSHWEQKNISSKQSTDLQSNLVLNTLISRNFCKETVRVDLQKFSYCVSHSVKIEGIFFHSDFT